MEFLDFLKAVSGRSVGLVYSFQPARPLTAVWYDRWHSDVIASHGRALETLGIHPYYVDVDSFCRQALAGTLPNLLCAFNLNAGVSPLSHWALVPSVGAWTDVPILPCDASLAVIGERKDVSAAIVANAGLESPRAIAFEALEHLPPDTHIIRKPRDLGGSVGIQLIRARDAVRDEYHFGSPVLYQEFVPGYDLTVPVLANPLSNVLEVLPGVVYMPHTEEPWGWFHSERTKRRGVGYTKSVIEVPQGLAHRILLACRILGITTVGRFDLRIRSTSPHVDPEALDAEAALFLEVNPCPTLRPGINLLMGVESARRGVLRDAFDVFGEIYSGEGQFHVLAYTLAACLRAGLQPGMMNHRHKRGSGDE